MSKKTDLASLRGLKAIARRKMNQKYWKIDEPAEHAKKRDEAQKLYEKELKEQILLLVGKMKPADMTGGRWDDKEVDGWMAKKNWNLNGY